MNLLQFHYFAVVGDGDVGEAGILEVGFVGFGGGEIAMNDKDALHLIDYQTAGEIVDHLLIIAVTGEAFDLGDLRLDAMIHTEDGYPLETGLLDTCAERGRFAIADDEDGASRIRDMVRHMVLDTSCLQHARSGDDDAGFVLMVERLGFADVGDVPQRIKSEGIGIELHGVAHLIGQFLRVHAEDLGSIGGHGRIDIDGYLRQTAVIIELVEHINDLLRTSD